MEIKVNNEMIIIIIFHLYLIYSGTGWFYFPGTLLFFFLGLFKINAV